jgi:hypothetical protein
MTFAKTSICVKYKYAEDWHVFASDDLPGLYVASRDAKKSFDDVGPAIQKLLLLDEGISCEVVSELDFREFIELAKGEASDEPAPMMFSDRRFAVYAQREAMAA